MNDSNNPVNVSTDKQVFLSIQPKMNDICNNFSTTSSNNLTKKLSDL